MWSTLIVTRVTRQSEKSKSGHTEGDEHEGKFLLWTITCFSVISIDNLRFFIEGCNDELDEPLASGLLRVLLSDNSEMLKVTLRLSSELSEWALFLLNCFIYWIVGTT